MCAKVLKISGMNSHYENDFYAKYSVEGPR